MGPGLLSTEDPTRKLKEEIEASRSPKQQQQEQERWKKQKHDKARSEKSPHDPDDHPEQTEELLHELIRKSCVEMALNRVDGKEELYVGGIWALRRPSALQELNITHILSVVGFDPAGLKSETDTWENYGKSYKHMVIDIDDVEDSDLLVHLPKAVRFIEDAFYPGGGSDEGKPESAEMSEAREQKSFKAKASRLKQAVERDQESSSESEGVADTNAITPVPEFKDLKLRPVNGKPGAVYVHCAMGKSRSVSVVVAYLLWKYPSRFGRSAASTAAARKTSAAKMDDKTAASIKERAAAAVEAAVKWVRNTREIAEPNPGFIQQLEMWWAMGCPDDVEGHPVYQRWAFKREIDESVAAGQAPSRLRFEDEELKGAEGGEPAKGKELRCKKCRRTLATPLFVLEHEPEEGHGQQQQKPQQQCAHWFVEPLGWMRDELEKGTLEGRLCCPNGKCGAAVGRYSWKGFRCSCGGWVTPAFSLQRARVDEVAAKVTGAAGMATLGIRMPPGAAAGPGRL
ncbi:dual specificity [Colletotrichum sojae]|uniref:protein-tyrosine-phosphatase n=1 Tax=Colletotrichum sojae TaxID=2175907 RepID=A0A8H6N206_9PEZI|nr:dual specificity [Colletotrichum sojae]